MDWPTIWNNVSDGTVWLNQNALGPTCDALEIGRDAMARHPNVVAAAIYFFIVLITTLVTIWVLRKSHINRVMHRNWDKPAAHHVLYFMLTVALANGAMHAIHQGTFPFRDLDAPLEALAGVPFLERRSLYALLLISLNLVFLVVLCGFFLVDAIRNKTFHLPGDKIQRAASFYFGHVIGVIASEELATALWEHYEVKTVVLDLVKLMHSCRGKNIFIAAIIVSMASWLARRSLKTAEGS
jgi:hypothetical protein